MAEHTMTTAITRFELQGLNVEVSKKREAALEEERKAKTLDFLVGYYKNNIMEAAREGKTSYTVSERDYHSFKWRHPPSCQAKEHEFYFYKQIRDKVFTNKFTDDNATELTEAFRKFFSGCTVTHKRISEEHSLIGRPSETYFVTLNEITIDWS